MDQQQLAKIVEDSVLSEEAKDLIYKLLPMAEKPEVKEAIMEIMRFEVKSSEMLLEEAQDLKDVYERAQELIDSNEENLEEKINEIVEDLSGDLREVEKSMVESVDSAPVTEATADETKAPTLSEPVTPFSPAPATTQPTYPWSQPSASAAPATPATIQSTSYPGTQTGQ